jgi:phosphatidylserine decarboxylase
MARTRQFPIAVEGFPLIIPMLAATLVSAFFGWIYLSICLSILTLFAIFFFRNPKRGIPPSGQAVVAPADGRVIRVDPCQEERFLQAKVTKISIFMSIFNVHVNRSPIAGIVEEKSYTPGRFHLANSDKSAEENEQNAMVICGKTGLKVLLVQIAGFVARRIVCYPEKGDALEKGQILGMIRFGSRLDIYLPEEVEPSVKPGDRVRAGESILGTIR